MGKQRHLLLEIFLILIWQFVGQSKLSENDPNLNTFYRIFQNFGFRHDTTLYRNNKLGTFLKNI